MESLTVEPTPTEIERDIKFDTEDPVESAEHLMKQISATQPNFIIALRAKDDRVFKIDFVKAVEAIVKKHRPEQNVRITEVENNSPIESVPVDILNGVARGTYAAPTYDKGACGNCTAKQAGDGGALRLCGRCKVRKYCSRDCQKEHWKLHKWVCQELGGGILVVNLGD